MFFLYLCFMAKNGNIHPTRIFKSPDELEQAWILYKENLKLEALEWVKVQYVGKEGQRMEDAFKLPYTMEGFSVFCYKNFGVIRHYFLNTDNMYDNFCTICSHIKEEIRSNQITGGLLGMYNPSITQRLNNLAENTKTTLEGSLNTSNIPDIGDRK
jgi:hypothetical protein